MEQAWQQVLTPAAESLNTRWRTAVVDGWNNAFSGRYPFKNVSSDASLPLLAKYLNTDTGRIARFLQNNLSGVLRRKAIAGYRIPLIPGADIQPCISESHQYPE